MPAGAGALQSGGVQVLLIVAGLVVTVLGLVLLALPAVPALGIIFSGVALVAWADGFTRIGWGWIAVLLALTVAGSLADNLAALAGARRAGASAWGVAGAGLGALAGIPFGIPGLILGPAIGAFALEFAKNPDLRRAGLAGLGGLAGFVLGVVARSVFGVVIVGLAVLAYIF